jgi:hypothetical protein
MMEKKLLGFRQKNSGEEKPSSCLYFKEEKGRVRERRRVAGETGGTASPPRVFVFLVSLVKLHFSKRVFQE